MTIAEKVYEETVKWVGSRPMTFDEFVERYGSKDDVELIDGAVVERNVVQLDHGKLEVWLLTVLALVVDERQLGILLGSRTAVEINQFRGRLPDLLFVSRRMRIVRQKAVYGAPDLVIEIVSPNDRASDIIALEADYRTIGVPEIVFIDLPKKQVRVLRKETGDYREEILTAGGLVLTQLSGLSFKLDWLLEEPRPPMLQTVEALLGQLAPPAKRPRRPRRRPDEGSGA